MPDTKNSLPTSESLDEQLRLAVEELITGDADDSPLSEEAILGLLSASLEVQKLGDS